MKTDFVSLKAEFGKLFENPLNVDSVIKKAAIVAFHALTLGIPLAIYYIVDYRFPKVEETASVLKEIALRGFEEKYNLVPPQKGQVRPYTVAEWNALSFAEKKLKEHPEFENTHFFKNLFAGEEHIDSLVDHYKNGPPTNPKISALTGVYKLYQAEILKRFNGLKDPWNNDRFLKLYDEYLKISFAVSILTLEDLASLTRKMPLGEQHIYRTLVRQDAYPFIAFGFGLKAYNLARNEGVWTAAPHDRKYPEKLTKSAQFYTEGTLQNRWNKLYNDFCRRFRMYASEEDLSNDPRRDDRAFLGTKPDLKEKDYES